MRFGPPGHLFTPVRTRFIRHRERLGIVPAIHRVGERDLILPQRFAVRLRRVLSIGRAKSNVRSRDDHRRTLRVGLGGGNGNINRRKIVHIGHMQHVPSIRFEPLRSIIAA